MPARLIAAAVVSILAAAAPIAASAAPLNPPTPPPADAPAHQWWAGTLSLPGPRGPIPVGVVFAIAPDPAASTGWSASLDLAPGPGTPGISAFECSPVTVTAAEIVIEAPPPIGAAFHLKRTAPDATTAAGHTIIEGLPPLPITLGVVSAAEARTRIIPRPQTPRPPFPYAREAFSVVSAADGLTLAGTLTRPVEADAPSPAVVLVSDAGPQDRDHTESHHRPFLVLADSLTRRGFAVLRLDDRGVGASEGVFDDATIDTFAADLRSAVAALGTRPEIDPSRITVLGIGEGAVVAALAAAEEPRIAALVLVSPPGLPGRELALVRERRRMEAEGEDPTFIKTHTVRSGRVLELVVEGADQEAIAGAVRESIVGAAGDRRGTMPLPEDWQLEQAAAQQAFVLTSPAMRRWLTLDPAGVFRGVAVPVLVLAGDLNLVVPTGDNLPKVEAAIRESGAELTLRRFPGLNHNLQPSTTGFSDEPATIQTTIDPGALGAIADWLAGMDRR